MDIKLSIILPLYNEEESIKELYDKIIAEIKQHQLTPYEIIYINDGSTDESLNILKSLKQTDQNIRIINFFRNYGKAAALSVGFKVCRGEFVVTMDADLQDDPNEISKFISLAVEDNLDMISGWKKERHDPLEKRIPSKFFNYVTSKMGGIRLHDFNCGLKFYRHSVVKSVQSLLYGDMHRFIPLLAFWQGFRVGEMVVQHHARPYGKSKYGIARYLHGFLDLLTLSFLNRFKSRPMHIFGIFGILTLIPGSIINIYFLIVWIMTQTLHMRPILLLGVVLMVVSFQFFSLGFISEMLTQRSSKEDNYSFDEI